MLEVNHITDGVNTNTVKHIKARTDRQYKAIRTPVVIRCKDGASIELSTNKRFKIVSKGRSLHINEEEYLYNTSKYDDVVISKVIITCNDGTHIERDNYKKKHQGIMLPDSSFARARVKNKKLHKHYVTDDEEHNCNKANMLHLLVWWMQSLIVKMGDYVVVRSNPSCYVCREGIYNIDTCELMPPMIALQKVFGYTKLEAYYICTTFYQQCYEENIKAIRGYVDLHYGKVEMPQVAPDALNYILGENILGVVPVGYGTLFGILTDNFHISKEVIYEMMDRNLIIVDSHFNICFLSYDLNGNVASIYKMSRYNHSDIKYSFNHYVTQADVGFGYCSSEAERHNFFENVVVFDTPIEMLSYLTLERKSNSIVPSFDESTYYMSMYYGNVFAVRELLNKHDEVNTFHIATRFVLGNNYVKDDLLEIASTMKVPHIQELNELVAEYANKATSRYSYSSFRVEGWNALIRLHLNLMPVRFNALSERELLNYGIHKEKLRSMSIAETAYYAKTAPVEDDFCIYHIHDDNIPGE